ncbi:hypothetical protein GYMLUDRAFT_245036 [Collybiopsis luxurians FD-317 M1]|uniref:Uncharacterized protein n=1 Tax=Collybiopsis luxurians FD-317 M1 TaxID=944289 RepID=A0A0D0CBG4_9AGAR|nr:hypothetical protein GYMLUDRAFT_245036 [Collybiopsis luxurians FD-317 M1]
MRPAHSSNSSKRARSPDETYSSSRPSKRISLATEADYALFCLRGSSSASSSRQNSEEWVQQAGNLTINSPLLIGNGTRPFEDHVMVTESMQNQSNTAASPAPYGRPHLAPLQTSFPRMQLAPKPAAQVFPPHMVSTDSPLLRNSAPSIHVLPPTPVSHPTGCSATTRPATPMNESPMSVSTSPLSANVLSPSRRNRGFAMGPRADCEKCRMGVKGHSVHLD